MSYDSDLTDEDWAPRLTPFVDSFVAEYDDLTGTQQHAFYDAITWLWGLAKEPRPERTSDPRRPGQPHAPRMDERRLANTFLIDGARGSGKSITLVKLLDVIERASPWSTRQPDGKDPDLAVLSDRLRSEVAFLPLQMLDLKPFPDRPLVLELAGALFDVVRAVEGQRAMHDPFPDGLATRPAEARSAWESFARAAALGMARSPDQHLDPTDYVAELVQAREQRSEIGPAFHNLIEKLVEALQRTDRPASVRDGSRQNVLFVLPIDDADMHPQRTPQLLDLLRLLRHPRLAYIVTGDSQLFLDELEASFSRRGETPSTANRRVRPADLAAQALDKVFPEPQRARLPPLTPEARFHLLEPSLDELLSGLENREDLADRADLQSDVRCLKARLARSDYLLAEVLPDGLRTFSQVKAVFFEMLPLVDASAMTSLVRDRWRVAIDGEDLSAPERAHLRRAVDLVDGEGTKRRVESNQALVRGAHQEVRLAPTSINHSPNLTLQRDIGQLRVAWQLRFGLSFHEQALSEGSAAAYAMATAFATDESAHRGLEPLRHLPFVEVKRSRDTARLLLWPTPEWRKMDELLAFIETWQHLLPLVHHDESDKLARLFVASVIHSLTLYDDPEYHALDEIPTWERIMEWAVHRDDGSGALHSWLTQSWHLIATPEGGLPDDAADNALKAWFEFIEVTNSEPHEFFVDAPKSRSGWLARVGVPANTKLRRDHPWVRELGYTRELLLEDFARWRIGHAGLGDLVVASETREHELNEVLRDLVEVRGIRTVLSSSIARGDNSAVAVVGPLWNVLSQDQGIVQRPAAGTLVVAPRARFEVRSPGGGFDLKFSDRTVTLGANHHVSIDDTAAASSLVYRLAWDVAAHFDPSQNDPFIEAQSAGIPGSPSILPWKALTVRSSNGDAYHWPLPGLPTLYASEQLCDRWQEMLSTSRGVADADEPTREEFLIGLALAWTSELAKNLLTAERAGQRTVSDLRSSTAPMHQLADRMIAMRPFISEYDERNAPRTVWWKIAVSAFSDPTMSGLGQDFTEALSLALTQADESPIALAELEHTRDSVRSILRANE